MSTRKKFIEYVKHGSDNPIVSLQIGAGAGFDTKLAGKIWNSETTLEDTIKAYEIVGGLPFYNIGLPDFGQIVPELKANVKEQRNDQERFTERIIESPFGPLQWKFHEIPKSGVTPLRYPITMDDINALDKVKWYAEQHLKGAKYVCEILASEIEHIQQYGPVSIQWNVQPFELLGLASVDNLVVLAMINPQQYRNICDLICDVNIEILKEVFKAGADFIFLGGAGAEMMSPDLYKEYIIPDSKRISNEVHNVGGLIYSHICSPIEPFLGMGFYDEMGIDLFETLSPPPVGNVPDLVDARKCLNSEICTRGNIGLDLMLNGTIDDVVKATVQILEATKGTKHMVAASDYLFYDIPLENVKAVVETVKNWSE